VVSIKDVGRQQSGFEPRIESLPPPTMIDDLTDTLKHTLIFVETQ